MSTVKSHKNTVASNTKNQNNDTNSDPYLEKHFKGHLASVTDIGFSPRTDQLLSSSADCTLIIWSVQQSTRCYKFIGHTDAILTAKYSPDGSLIATGSKDRTVRLWTPRLKGECTDFKAHMSSVRSLDFSSDGSKLVTGSDDKIIKLWQVSNAKFITSVVAHTNWVQCVRFSPGEQQQILSCSDDRTIQISDLRTGSNIHTFRELKGYGVHVEYHPNSFLFAVGLSNGNVKLYDIRTQRLQQHYQIHSASLTKIAFHPSGNYLLTASLDSSMKILDLLEGRPIYTLEGHNGAIRSVAFSKTGENFASGGADHNVLVWKTNFEAAFDVDNGKYKSKFTTFNRADDAAARRVSIPDEIHGDCLKSDEYGEKLKDSLELSDVCNCSSSSTTCHRCRKSDPGSTKASKTDLPMKDLLPLMQDLVYKVDQMSKMLNDMDSRIKYLEQLNHEK